MKAIYYPGFQVQDDEWLKFALLYVDQLRPIVPHGVERTLPDWYQRLIQDTDLISPYEPDPQDGRLSTLDALDEVERILRNPSRYRLIFRCPDVSEKWRKKAKQDFVLYSDKYTFEWESFCIENALGHHSDEGLMISKELGYIYMSIMAHCIGDNNSVSVLTDIELMDRFLMFVRRRTTRQIPHLRVAKSIIDIQLPTGLRNIDIKTIVALRNRDSFRRKLRAFHNELQAFYHSAEREYLPHEFIDTYKGVYRDFLSDIMILGSLMVNVGLEAWTTFHGAHGTNQGPLMYNDIAATVGTAIAVRQHWTHTESRRFCRKYLVDLKRAERDR